MAQVNHTQRRERLEQHAEDIIETLKTRLCNRPSQKPGQSVYDALREEGLNETDIHEMAVFIADAQYFIAVIATKKNELQAWQRSHRRWEKELHAVADKWGKSPKLAEAIDRLYDEEGTLYDVKQHRAQVVKAKNPNAKQPDFAVNKLVVGLVQAMKQRTGHECYGLIGQILFHTGVY